MARDAGPSFLPGLEAPREEAEPSPRATAERTASLLGVGLTGVIELHEAKGGCKMLQAVPLALVEVSGVQEEGEVGQKELLEPA